MTLLRFVAVVATSTTIASAGAAFAAAPVVALVDSAQAPRDGRQELRAAVVRALRELGAEVIPQAHVRSFAGACDNDTCVARIGEATGANYVMRVLGAYDNGGFRLRLEVWDTRPAKMIAADEKNCAACAMADMYREARERTAVLGARALASPAPAPPTPTEPPAALVVAPPPPTRPLWRQPLAVAGAAAVGVGLGAAIVGLRLLAVDGERHASCEAGAMCAWVRDTAGAGAGLLVGGAAAVLGGAALVYFGRERPVGLVLAPDGFAVAGIF